MGLRSQVDLYGRVKGQGHQVKMLFQVSFDYLAGNVRGQRSYESGSKVTWVNPSLKVIILAGGLTSTSSCIFYNYAQIAKGQYWIR